jgi:hypothetical protein
VAADHRVVLADDETVRIVSPTLPGHVRVASPSGRPQLDDGAKCAATHAWRNNPLMKIIPDSGYLPPRGGGASSGTRPARHDQAAHPDCLGAPGSGGGGSRAGRRWWRSAVCGDRVADSWGAGGHSPRVGHRLAGVGLMAQGRWQVRCCEWRWRCRCWPRGGDRTGRGGAPVRPVGAPLCSLTGLGVALTAIPWSRWQLAVPLLDRRPAGI